MEKKRKASLTFSVVALALVVSMAAGLFMQRSGLMPKSYIVFAGDSSPDEYGNRIDQVLVYQDKTGDWECVATFTVTNYTSGMTVEIDANYDTHLRAIVYINKTLCNNEQPKAKDYTRVYWNVSTVYSDDLGNFLEYGVAGDFYWVRYNSTSWTPATDTTYDCTVEYEAYY